MKHRGGGGYEGPVRLILVVLALMLGCVRTQPSGTGAIVAPPSLRTGRLGLITSEEDGLLAAFTGQSGAQFREGVRDLEQQHFTSAPSAAFVVPGARHVFLDEWTVERNGVSLTTWLRAFGSGEGFGAR